VLGDLPAKQYSRTSEDRERLGKRLETHFLRTVAEKHVCYTGKIDEALALCKELVELEKRAGGPEQFNTLVSMSTLGQLLVDQGQYAEARLC
jgi:hypothetical protein